MTQHAAPIHHTRQQCCYSHANVPAVTLPTGSSGMRHIETKWEIVNGRQVCVEVTLHEPFGVTATGLRQAITIANIEAQRPVLSEATISEAEHRRTTIAAARNQGLRIADVADIYAKAWTAGAKPTRAVAQALSISQSAAAKRVARARAAGLIPPTMRGKGGW